MLKSYFLLFILLHGCAADIATRLSPRYSDVLKMKCDALPYRTAYHEQNCYFAIDAKSNLADTSNSCSMVLRGAHHSSKTPADVWDSLFVDKREFLLDGDSTGEKKAMCIYETPVDSSTKLPPSNAKTSISRGETNMTAGIHMPVRLPFTEGIKPGQTIIIKGYMIANTFGFYINFQSDTNPHQFHRGANFPFHIGVRLYNDGYVIVLSTLTNGKWHEQRVVSNPYKKTDSFDIRVRVLNDRYQLFLEQKEWANYKFTLPISMIKYLYIEDVVPLSNSAIITYVHLGEKYKPLPSSTSQSTISLPVCSSKQSTCFATAQRELFNSRVQVADCKPLIISGVVEAHIDHKGVVTDVKSFHVKLIRKNGDIALIFWVRFDKNKVGLDTFKNGKWTGEETVNRNPFKKNVRFEMSITNEARGFEIFVDGAYFTTFDHRTCSHDISTVEVQGVLDLNIQV